MNDLLSFLILGICIWILISIGAKSPKKVSQFNQKARRKARSMVRSLLTDDDKAK